MAFDMDTSYGAPEEILEIKKQLEARLQQLDQETSDKLREYQEEHEANQRELEELRDQYEQTGSVHFIQKGKLEKEISALETLILDKKSEREQFELSQEKEKTEAKEKAEKEIKDAYRKITVPEEIQQILKKKEKNLDRIRGSLIGGAAGDALGYAIEFEKESSIFGKYGEEGITEYQLDEASGKAIISDDTQMTLFTADGLLKGRTCLEMNGFATAPHRYVAGAYHDWLLTQDESMNMVCSNERKTQEGGWSWLLDVPELYAFRAPGNTCLDALRHPVDVADYLKISVNNSKGCGGVMRVAPVALLYDTSENGTADIQTVDKEAAYVAAVTHGHPLGYMPAAVVAHIINRLVYGPMASLKDIVIEAKKTCETIFAGKEYLEELSQKIDLAIELSENNDSDINNIHAIGEGWVGEETLGIAIYCALKYQKDFSKALITAVNHDGDSDSTGAVTGNILGAMIGYDLIEDKWKKDLELHDVILEIAADLCHDCQMNMSNNYRDLAWIQKYVEMRRFTLD